MTDIIKSQEEMSTEEVMIHHIGALGISVGEIMKDYNEDSILFTQVGVFKGIEEITKFFNTLIIGFTKGMVAKSEIIKMSTKEDYAYIIWKVKDEVPLISNTFHIMEGKILMQSFAIYQGNDSTYR